MKRLMLITFSFIMLLSTGSFSQATSPDSSQLAALLTLQIQLNNSLAVHWSDELGTPDMVVFGKPRMFDTDPVHSGSMFLATLKALLGQADGTDSWVQKRIAQFEGVTYIRFQQEYEAVPVDGGEYVVTVLPGGKVLSVSGNFYKSINIDAHPLITAVQAKSAALASVAFGYSLKDSLRSSTLTVVRRDGAFHLAWILQMPEAASLVSWTYLVDAKTGTILDQYRCLLGVDGSANAFIHSPCIDYSSSSVTLHDLAGDSQLEGTYVYVNTSGTRAYNEQENFTYQTTDAHFDEAQAYYFMENAHSYWASLISQQVSVYVHTAPYGGGDCAGGWSGSSILLGDGCGDPAREDKVCYHEYSHFAASSLGVNFSSSQNNEQGGISEGMADFFAADYTGRTQINDCAWPAQMRDITNPDFTTYAGYTTWKNQHNGTVDRYVAGGYWSYCLWQLRGALSSTAAYLTRNSISSLTTSSTFSIARQKIIEQDRSLCSGADVQKIANLFYQRGIDYDSLGNVGISGPDCLQLKQNGTWSASVGGGSTSFSYQWYYEDAYSGGWIGLGTSQTQSRSMGGHSFDMRCDITDNGLGLTKSSTYHVEYGCEPKIAPPVLEKTPQPIEYALEEAYPNPFNPSTTLRFALPEAGYVSVYVYDVVGRAVTTLVSGNYATGRYSINWDASSVSSGTYYARLIVSDELGGVRYSKVVKLLLLK
ncbi:MAG TPA: T9SS type A sorting domain-containing protein [Bacteroidota bacterium]|nr:T9SS type A sorting domain-containing protein [Bacteroidota bacterium]